MQRPLFSPRDSVLLILCFTILVVTTALGWAGQMVATPIRAMLLGISIQPMLNSLHIIALGMALLGLMLSTVYALLNRRLLPDFLNSLLQQPIVGYSSLTAIITIPLAHVLLNRSHLQPVLTVGMGLTTGLLLLNLLYERDPIDSRRVVLTIAWAAAGLLAVETFSVLQGWEQVYHLTYRLRPAKVAPYTSPFWLIFLGLAVLLAAGPLVQGILPIRRQVRAWNQEIGRLPVPVLLIPILVMLVVHIVAWITDRPTLLLLINRLAIIFALLSVAPIVYRGEAPDAQPVTLSLSPRATRFWWWLIVGSYCLLVIPVAIAWIAFVNQDALSYLEIAQHYAEGASAIRGLWSPLFSWLLVPAIWLKIDPIVAARAINALVGLGWLLAVSRLARHFEFSPVARLCVMAMTGLFFLKNGFWPLGPDSLSAFILLIYFLLLTGDLWKRRPVWLGLGIGLIGAVAYFTRAFNFPFILVHVLLTAVIYSFTDRHQTRPIFLTAAVSIVTLISLSSPWISALSQRYGHFTISVAGEYNRANFESNFSLPCNRTILCDQPADVLFPWEDPDPASYQSLAISPLSSFERLSSHIRGLGHNAAIWSYTTLRNLTLLSLLALVGATMLVFINWPNAIRRRRLLWLLMTIALYLVGYFQSTSAELRYYYPLVPLIFALLYLIIERVASAWRWPLPQALWIGRLLMIGPLLVFAFHPTGYASHVRLFVPPDRCQVTDGQRLTPSLNPPIAGVNLDGIESISYFSQTRTYGSLSSERVPMDDLVHQLRALDVQTVLVPAHDVATDLLIDRYGFVPLMQITFCSEEIQVLEPPRG